MVFSRFFDYFCRVGFYFYPWAFFEPFSAANLFGKTGIIVLIKKNIFVELLLSILV